jgi:hypothetical protein
MSPDNDPIPALKREACAQLAEFLRYGNGDDLASLLGTDRFRIADLRRGRRQRRDGPGSGARAEAMLPGCVGSIALVARKTPGGSARV